ncbi:MAG: putative molybdenum carrier protein [Gammaproteobacteria bacterium]|nr:putative molybdenum carrier protein [Gammaproteobacteria bacterium]MDD9823586.1 putative molybdenum carrier protein [Gammaproteobacteria bacterium]MDD9863953.1 putative molybdenum carrier protein [Gammaproteobacteria bacterium]
MIGRILSGGQSGADRAALDFARQQRIPSGGWCPKGRRAEDGRIPERYPLQETASENYAERTRQNVMGSDGTLVLHSGPLQGGTLLTLELADRLGKPRLLCDLRRPPAPRQVRAWLQQHRIRALNVAGPRESQRPGIYRQALAYLRRVADCPEP